MLRHSVFTAYLLFLGSPFFAYPQTQVNIAPSKDNTLYEDASGSLSGGASGYFFVGKTSGGLTRRGILAFDIAGNIPAGAAIQTVTLTLSMSRSSGSDATIGLHRVLADWGEGTSNPSGNGGMGAPATSGDATWLHRSFNTVLWTNAGGDLNGTASSSVLVQGTGSYTWPSTSSMVSDVQNWLNNASSNFGWVLIGDESQPHTAKRFDSRENSTAAARPRLTVTYNPPVPIQLASFTATALNNSIRLDWRTISEINNYGFYVHRKRENEVGWFELPNSFVAGHGTTNEPQTYSYRDEPVQIGTYYYRLKQVDLDGTVHLTDPVIARVVTSADETKPLKFSLEQNYPNPFNPTTRIRMHIPIHVDVSLDVHDVLGRSVASLIDESLEPGVYDILFDGSGISSGTYFYRLRAGSFVETKRLVVLR
jgi:hypothetical protein